MKKVIFVLLFALIGQTDIFAKVSTSSSTRSSSTPRTSSTMKTSNTRASSMKNTATRASSGKSGGIFSNVETQKGGRYSSRVDMGGSKGIRTFKSPPKTSSTAKSTVNYNAKPFAEPKRIATSKLSPHQVTFVYTRPVIFYNPYHTYYFYNNIYRPDSAKIDTTAFPGFGKGKSGGAGASASFANSLTKHESKDSLEITELKPINYLSDFSGIIPDKDEVKINSMIRQYKKKTGVEIAVLTIPTLGDEIDMEDYIQVIFDKWGIGETGVNNGVMLVISSEDEIVRIQPGYGMEEFLPDATCREIEDKIMIPLCEKGQWELSVTSSVEDIIKRLGTKPVEIMKQELAARKIKEHQEMIDNVHITLKIFGVLFFILIMYRVFRKKKK